MQKRIRATVLGVGVALVIVGSLTACGDDTERKAASATVNVTVSEWLVKPEPASVPHGSIKFVGKNAGGLVHEVVVVSADSVASLPKKADGSFDEDKISEAAKVGEVEDIAGGVTKSATLEVNTPGTYIVFCNLIDKDGTSHAAKGMAAILTVT